jgi:hypothetical protein
VLLCIDGCGDCSAEVKILLDYLQKYPERTSIAIGNQQDIRKISNRLRNRKGLRLGVGHSIKEQPSIPSIKITVTNDPLFSYSTVTEGEPNTSAPNDTLANPEQTLHENVTDSAEQSTNIDQSNESTTNEGQIEVDGEDEAEHDMEEVVSIENMTPDQLIARNIGLFSQEISDRIAFESTRSILVVAPTLDRGFKKSNPLESLE